MNQWEIDGKTRLYGLLGNPVSHSLSPFIHNEGFRRLSLNARYLAFSVKEEDLESTLSALRKMGVGGLNLTMPLKEAVLPLCDSLSKSCELHRTDKAECHLRNMIRYGRGHQSNHKRNKGFKEKKLLLKKALVLLVHFPGNELRHTYT